MWNVYLYFTFLWRDSKKEVNENYPSRSAKLRYAIRNSNNFIYPSRLLQNFSKYLDLEGINV